MSCGEPAPTSRENALATAAPLLYKRDLHKYLSARAGATFHGGY
jgi:hypothetical protein